MQEDICSVLYDDGRTWNDLIIPCSVPSEINYSGLGGKLPAYNRGALYEGKDGRIFWAVVASDTEALRKYVGLFAYIQR